MDLKLHAERLNAERLCLASGRPSPVPWEHVLICRPWSSWPSASLSFHLQRLHLAEPTDAPLFDSPNMSAREVPAPLSSGKLLAPEAPGTEASCITGARLRTLRTEAAHHRLSHLAARLCLHAFACRVQ